MFAARQAQQEEHVRARTLEETYCSVREAFPRGSAGEAII
jgi:hypothetical protein